MNLEGRRVLVTGGAGHVGSHLADQLASTCEVVVADNLSAGSRDRVPSTVEFERIDLTEAEPTRALMDGVEVVFHLAVAEKAVSAGAREQFEGNVDLTFTVLEAAIDAGVEGFAFTSSSTVYGEDVPLPTPESHGPPAPISPYGAAKLAEEGILSTAVESADMQVWVARLANVVGPVFDGTVIPDFVEKLTTNPDRLEILGDGRQEKSFVHVEDTARAVRAIVEGAPEPFAVYNVGTPAAVSIREVGEIVADVMDLDPSYSFTGGDRGWTGDVPRMELDVDRLRSLGWEPAYSCDAAVERAATQLHRQRDVTIR